ncbi:tripartite tricarboxylate transporter substrate binding protein [Variovorax sp. NFACC27]|uniref:Bug family tripartite tricarboxylate transporter substrate binding protein n=1 Tax=unclassified Variovorax TaxID=663243 RepID=UPI000894F50D|nr:Tripartite-type tricarboxylate transporter, receptor component TctC [Variovorax sp. NFACC28]SEG25633.1 Tripartite-type tricarboxylate transporter, receptor component TctC [Variovorax sp. NFACC29]SFC46622.1 Tripartite-type tricarboxylate transporter, receptor component TctC [Variovorax sp. NFACC26]SFF92290.1 Tripartite-type tricarboxylate transporter, receptor component TctC [Variovorax sp. NFACC27]
MTTTGSRYTPYTFFDGTRRRLAIAAACAALALGATATGAFAADAPYPTKPVKFLTNFPAGGPIDILARALADALQKDLKQPFIVDNRPGAGGNIGADFVAKAPADGYTVLMGIDSTFTINPHLYASMPFAAKDLKPLMIFSSSGLAFGVAQGVKAKTLPEFIAQAKAEPATFSSAGNGSPGHIAAEIFASETGAKITHVPYKGNAPAVLALMGDEVQAGILATPGLLPQIQAGKLRALAATGKQRSPLLPQVPTVGELGLKGLEFEVLYLAMVPAATPEPVMQTLRGSLQKALALPEIKSRLSSLDMVPLGETGGAASEHLAASQARYGRIVKATGMKVD